MPDVVRPGQSHQVASLEETPLAAIDAVDTDAPPSSLLREAWSAMRVRPLFWFSSAIIVLVIALALVPQFFTSVDPRLCVLSNSYGPAESGHIFGFDQQGCDIYARTIYGARASVTVGVLTTIAVVIIGGAIGAVAGFFGGWFDALLSRITDIFFAIPLVLAAIVVMQVFKDHRDAIMVTTVLAVFGWPQIARIMRGSVMSVRNSDFITSATSLGASRWRILIQHAVPNAIAPVIVTATVSLGIYIVAEATLSFLGIGLPPSVVSWGGDISQAQKALRQAPNVLFYPAGALAFTVLGFIMMGDVVRDALDPKARKR